jgi:DNA topoisomerase-1
VRLSPSTTIDGASSRDVAERASAGTIALLSYTPDKVAKFLPRDELRLYTLIYNRFVASQMMPAVFDQTSVDISAADTLFRATGQIMKFDGFIRVYTEGRDDDKKAEDDDEENDAERSLPALREGETLKLHERVGELVAQDSSSACAKRVLRSRFST